MSDKRYTVFVSSTFRDLAEERQAALRAILALGHFPTGMEVFPAAGDTPWEMISRVIADSDYYVLIIAGRYGSIAPEGISYTEREYEEALKLGKYVLAFLHDDPDSLSASKSELSAKPRRQLDRFRKRVKDTHIIQSWRDGNELALKITQGLLNAFDLKPATGWVRSGGPDVVRLLSELNDVRQELAIQREDNVELREQLRTSSRARIRDFDPEGAVQVRFKFGAYKEPDRELELSWASIFFGLAPALLEGKSPGWLRGGLAKMIISVPSVQERFPKEVEDAANYELQLAKVQLTEDCLQSILLGLMARGLIVNRKEWRTYSDLNGKTSSTDLTMWYLTPEGQRLYLEQRSN
jgi:hypothetical protein